MKKKNSLIPVFAAGAFLVSLILGLYALTILFDTVLYSSIPFDTDEADHANAGLDLWAAIRSKDLFQIGGALTRQAFYPPLHSVTVALTYFFSGGPSYFSSRFPSVLCYALIPLALWWSITPTLQKKHRLILGSLGAVLTLLSPLHLRNSSLTMLEPLGMLITLLLLGGVARIEQWSPYRSSVSITLGSLLLFLTKYNLAVMVLPGLFLALFTLPSKLFPKKNFFLTVLWTSLGAAGWILLSDLKSFLAFLTGHPSYAPLLSSKNLFFELLSWTNEYTPSFVGGAICLFLGAYGILKSWRTTIGKVHTIILLTGWTLLLLSTTNESRHFMAVVPSLWVLILLGTQALIGEYVVWGTVTAVTAWACMVVGGVQAFPTLSHRITQEMEGHSNYGPLQGYIFSELPLGTRLLVAGATDSFSLESLRWHAARSTGKRYTDVQVDAFPFQPEKDRTAQVRKRNRAFPFTQSEQPKLSLKEVLTLHHYDAVALILLPEAKEATRTLLKEIDTMLASYPHKRKHIGEHAVVLITLSH